jgi:hypothetical protein
VLAREPAQTAAAPPGPAPGGRDVDHPVPATAAYAADPASPPAPLPPPARAGDPVLAEPPGLPPGALEQLVRAAAARARALLADGPR